LESGKCPSCTAIAPGDFKAVIARFTHDRGNLIPILHALQDNMGYLSAEAMDETAVWLSIHVSEVFGTATFYPLFALEPRGTYVIRMCDSPPCHIEGSGAIRKALEEHLGVTVGDTTDDGVFTFEEVSCLGLCGVAPSIMIGEDVYGNLTPELIPTILGKYREGGA
jgi:NADH-quinone oxidoreductase subunit E